jgi:hypothetical protein
VVVRIRPTRVRLFLFIRISSIRVRLLRRAVMGVMDRILSQSAIKVATVPQVMALRLRLHLAEGEGQLYHPLSASEPPDTGLGGSEL